ncbi:hypothetical protein NIES4075_57830 [Tolypothrix sp. NIES-4075]|uniref:hypothetical protein n=1 Tax=Tolypothrix sp. NIES-4075 TaxID=2005459 RepID=UPI000B5C1DFF|nr:hypothetical protein [Tolypothrix sp. NIES-4075]GAX44764.1 hypothetical protein NIES4075_57830 [Tolypothrix sp. NIES-4075]
MSVSSTGRTISQQQKLAKLKGDTTVEIENNQGNSLNTDAQGQDIDKLVKLESPNVEVHDTLAISHVRPTSASDLHVAHTMNSSGIRPIGENTMEVVESIYESGVRPIASSGLIISQTYSAMGNRPVASNTIDDPDSIMGFLD